MTSPLTVLPRQGFKSFIDSPLCLELDELEAGVAILGVPYGYAYNRDDIPNDQSNAPTAVRAWSYGASTGPNQWDFDLGGTVHDGREVRVVDCGDAAGSPRDVAAHYANAEAAARCIVDRGALLVTIGGDHGVPIPVFRAFEKHGPITLVQVDAHLDWRDDVDGVPEGYSSPIRRASEMDHIDRIVQIGLRSQGSAREGEVRDALAYGAELISAYEVHEGGMAAVLDRIPDGGRYYLTIDADGVDPSVMPAVMAPAPGGLLFHQMRALIHGLVAKGRVVGMDIVEITPKFDVNGVTSIAAGRLILNLIGAATRADYFG
jgi:agmatinase